MSLIPTSCTVRIFHWVLCAQMELENNIMKLKIILNVKQRIHILRRPFLPIWNCFGAKRLTGGKCIIMVFCFFFWYTHLKQWLELLILSTVVWRAMLMVNTFFGPCPSIGVNLDEGHEWLWWRLPAVWCPSNTVVVNKTSDASTT